MTIVSDKIVLYSKSSLKYSETSGVGLPLLAQMRSYRLRRFFLFPRLCCSQTPWVNGWYDIQHFQMEKLQLLKTTKCFTIGSIFEKVSMSSKHRLGVSFIHYRSYTKQPDVTYQFLLECLSL